MAHIIKYKDMVKEIEKISPQQAKSQLAYSF